MDTVVASIQNEFAVELAEVNLQLKDGWVTGSGPVTKSGTACVAVVRGHRIAINSLNVECGAIFVLTIRQVNSEPIDSPKTSEAIWDILHNTPVAVAENSKTETWRDRKPLL